MTAKAKDFSYMINKLNELRANKHAWVRVELIEKFVEFARSWGLNPCGGAISNNCKTQVIYID